MTLEGSDFPPAEGGQTLQRDMTEGNEVLNLAILPVSSSPAGLRSLKTMNALLLRSLWDIMGSIQCCPIALAAKEILSMAHKAITKQ